MFVNHTCPVNAFCADPCRAVAFTPSDATGVGKSVTVVLKSIPPSPCAPGPFVSEVRGVGSSAVVSVAEPPRVALGVGKYEYPEPSMWCPNIGCTYTNPLRVIPEIGKVSENTSKSSESRSIRPISSQQSRFGFHLANGVSTVRTPYVFPHNEPWPNNRDRFTHLHPKV